MNKSKRRPAPDRPSGGSRATAPVGKKSLFVLAASIAGLLVSAGATAHAQSWIGGDPGSPNVWSDNNNWVNPSNFPNSAGSTAIFDSNTPGFTGNFTPTISETDPTTAITVGTIQFNPSTAPFTITVQSTTGVASTSLTFSGGTGVNNTSGMEQTFIATGDATGGTGGVPVTTTTSASIIFTSGSGGTQTTYQINAGGIFSISGEPAGTTVTVGSISLPTAGAGSISLGGSILNTGSDNSSTSILGTIQDGGAGGGLNKTGTGTLTIDDSANTTKNSYSGGTTLTSGTLVVNSDATLGAATAIGTGAFTILGGTLATTATAASTQASAGLAAALANQPSNTNVSLVISNPVNIAGSFSMLNGSATNGDIYFTGLVTLDSTQTVTGLTAAGQEHFSGGIAGASSTVGINFIGGATTPSASGAMYTAFIYDGVVPTTYTGLTTVGNNAFLVLEEQATTNQAVIGNVLITQGGSLDLLASNQTATTITVTVNSGGINIPGGGQFQGLELQTFSTIIGTLNGNSTGTVGIGTGTLTVSNGNFAGDIMNSVTSGTISALEGGASFGALDMVGPGTLTLSGVNTYQAATNVTGGTLQAGSATGFSPNSAYTISSPGILDVNGFNTTVGSLAGTGIVTNTSTTPGTLITGFNSTNTSFTGSLQDGAGPLGLVKTGFGTFTVANSTYSGPTNVIEGVLQAGATTGFSPRSAYIISAPGFLDVNSFNSSIGSLAGNGTVTNFGTTAATLTTGFDNTNTTFSGTIQDSTAATISLVKTGTGAMTLASSNTFSGGTTLQNGSLVVSSILALGTGNVTVTGGALKASGPPIDIQVGGNYKQTGGELDLRVGGNTGGSFDRLAVIGSASLGGRLNVSSLNGYIPPRGTDITIITAGGGVNGKFQQVTGNLATIPQINLTLEYQPNDVVLQFNGTTFADIAGLTPNQKAVATALDNAVLNTKSDKVLNYLETLPTKSLPAAFDRIAPEEYGTIYQISVSSAKVQATSIENRLDSIHGRFPTGPGGPAGAPDATNPTTATQTSLGGVYANATGEFVSIGDSPIASGYNFSSGGVTVGADYRLNDNFVVGALLNYTRTRADLASSGRLDADGIRGGVYASLFGSGAYVNAYLGAGYNDYNMQRTGLDATVRGNTNGGEFNGLVQGGYDAHFGAYTFGPVASVQYTYTGLSSLVEQGSSDPLNIDSYREQSVRTNVGVRATYEWHIGHYILTPEIRATYQHEFADVVDSVTAGMLFGGPRFTVAGPQIGRDSILLNAGFTLTITPQIAGYLFYDGELGRSNYQDNNLLLGFRYDF